jgi:hypothetical protein
MNPGTRSFALRHAIAALALVASGAAWVAACGAAPLDIADYDRSCKKASDCVAVYIGGCGGCACPNAAINQRDEPRYRSDFDALGCAGTACPCVAEPPICKSGVCAVGGP